jgi:hypothetical protein
VVLLKISCPLLVDKLSPFLNDVEDDMSPKPQVLKIGKIGLEKGKNKKKKHAFKIQFFG